MADYRRERRGVEEHDADRTRPVEPADEYRRVERERMAREDSPTDVYLRRRELFDRISYVVWTIIAFIEALIGLRVLLKLIAANAGNPFVSFIYDFSGVFVNPFLGIVHDPTSGGAVLEINSLIGMLIYLLIGYGVLRLVWMIFSVTAPTDG